MRETDQNRLASTLTNVTVFLSGAEVSRVVSLELEAGEQTIVIGDLPHDADPQSIRAEGKADGFMEIGLVESRREAVSLKKALDKAARLELEQHLKELEDQVGQVRDRIAVLGTQKQLVENLAALPLQSFSGDTKAQMPDWIKIYDLIGDKLGTANDILFKAKLEERTLLDQINALKQRLNQKPPQQNFITVVRVTLRTKQAISGKLTLRYRIHNASWQPFYDFRLQTGGGEEEAHSEEKASLHIERRAEVRQSSGEPWDNVPLMLSTMKPSSSTSAPKLLPRQLDADIYAGAVAGCPTGVVAAPQMEMMRSKSAVLEQAEMYGIEADEAEVAVDQGDYHTSFRVPDLTQVDNQNHPVKVFLSSVLLEPELYVHCVPKLDIKAYLYTKVIWQDEVSLLAGKAWLYRDGIFIGNSIVPFVHKGESCRTGFGSDDLVRVTRIEKTRIKGKKGLIKNQNMDERHIIMTVKNLHKKALTIQMVDRIPYADNEKITVELLNDTTPPVQEDIKGQRGVLLWKQVLNAQAEMTVNLHYRVEWPKEVVIQL